MLAITVQTLPAQDITLRTATIGAELTGVESSKPDVTLYWGDDDAGETARAWDHSVSFRSAANGVYTTPLADLQVNSQYFYRAFGLNFMAGYSQWTPVATFRTLPPAAAQLQVEPATYLDGTAATIRGRVTENGGDTPTVTIVAGLADGGEQLSAWPLKWNLGLQNEGFTGRLEGLSPGADYIYRAVATNGSGATWTAANRFRTPMIDSLRISEFMASNSMVALSRVRPTPEAAFPKTLKSYDWIELQNSTDTAIDIGGLHLTDDPQQPKKWAFPAGTMVPARGYLVVYASGEDVRDPRLDEQGRLHTNFQLSSDGEYLALTNAEGAVVHAFKDPPRQYSDVSYGMYANETGHFPVPTPGATNAPLSAEVTRVAHEWKTVGDATSLVVTARVRGTISPLSAVNVHYRVMFGTEATVPMTDDGQNGDAVAGDGTFTATLPPNLATPGQMVRYSIKASSVDGLERREPTFVDSKNSPQYYGTIVEDPRLEGPVPVLHRFIETPGAANTARGTRASIYYHGELYDNVFIRIRGGTAQSWPKKSYKVEFNDDHNFLLNEDAPRVTEVDLNATYTDKSYTRPILTSDFQLDIGTPSPETYHIRMQQNGEFFSLALMVEQPDKEFLARSGLDPEGSLYKANPGSYYTCCFGSTTSFEKKTRDDEDKSDILALLQGLQLKDAALQSFLFDNVDLPAQINLMASHILAQNIDASDKNHFIYRDTNGTGEWQMLPWDLDLVFGPDALNTDTILANEVTTGATYPNAVHPFLGTRAFPLHDGKINMLIDGIINSPRTREMLLRRVRTLADDYLATGYFHRRIDELVEDIRELVPLDRAKWKTQAHFPGQNLPYDKVAQNIKERYLDRRLPYLTKYHVDGGVGIPQAQPADVSLRFGEEMVYRPESGRPGDEYLTIVNPNAYAVDLSNWSVRGSLQHAFKPGTVIPAQGTLYLVGNVAEFRGRTSSPRGGETRFVQGYGTELPDTGGRLQLVNPRGALVADKSFGELVVPAGAGNLRISEINYNPRAGNPEWAEAVAGGGMFEFIEVANIGDQPIEMAGVRFVEVDVQGDTQGIRFEFASQVLGARQSLVVVKDRAAFASRYGSQPSIARGSDGAGGVDGVYGGRLSDSGEQLTLVDASGTVIQQAAYSDGGDWSSRADGLGSSLEWIGGGADPAQARSWRASSQYGGTPGSGMSFPVYDVVVNEVLSSSVAPEVDRIELYNSRSETIDVTGWWISDDADNPMRYAIPAALGKLPPSGYLVLDETQLGFGFRSGSTDGVWLLATDSRGRITRFADDVTLPGTPVNRSAGRVPDGALNWQLLLANSFGQPNRPAAPGDRGDFNRDGRVDGVDLGMVCAAIRAPVPDLQYDLNTDKTLSEADLDVMVEDILYTTAGDANLNGVFDSQDFVLVMQAGAYDKPASAETTWEMGDWNCDGRFDSQDLIKAAQRGKYRPN